MAFLTCSDAKPNGVKLALQERHFEFEGLRGSQDPSSCGGPRFASMHRWAFERNYRGGPHPCTVRTVLHDADGRQRRESNQGVHLTRNRSHLSKTRPTMRRYDERDGVHIHGRCHAYIHTSMSYPSWTFYYHIALQVEVPGRGDDSRMFGPYLNDQSVYFQAGWAPHFRSFVRISPFVISMFITWNPVGCQSR